MPKQLTKPSQLLRQVPRDRININGVLGHVLDRSRHSAVSRPSPVTQIRVKILTAIQGTIFRPTHDYYDLRCRCLDISHPEHAIPNTHTPHPLTLGVHSFLSFCSRIIGQAPLQCFPFGELQSGNCRIPTFPVHHVIY